MVKYNLQTKSDFFRNSVNSSKYGLNSIKFFASNVWQMVPMEMKNFKSLEDFRNKIRRWEPDGCDCKLYKYSVANLRYVRLVWLWNIGLTVRISKFCLISSAKKYLLCQHLSASSQNVETAAGCEIGTGLAMVATE